MLVEIWCYVAWLFIVYVVVVDTFVGSAFYRAVHVALLHGLLCGAHCVFENMFNVHPSALVCVFWESTCRCKWEN